MKLNLKNQQMRNFRYSGCFFLTAFAWLLWLRYWAAHQNYFPHFQIAPKAKKGNSMTSINARINPSSGVEASPLHERELELSKTKIRIRFASDRKALREEEEFWQIWGESEPCTIDWIETSPLAWFKCDSRGFKVALGSFLYLSIRMAKKGMFLMGSVF